MTTIDWTKPILWDGKQARVLATDIVMPGGEPRRVAIAVMCDAGYEYTTVCERDGISRGLSGRVTNAPERVERWANAYVGAVGGSTRLRSDLDLHAGSRTALVRYVFEGEKFVSAEVMPLEDKP